MDRQIVERRLTTILSADVVGYSRLMSWDEPGTLAALKGHRRELLEPKAAQYHGRTVKLMGDGTLMEFASVVDALMFAIEVQCAMRQRNANVPEDRRIIYRIGINIGDIIVEGDDIYGEGVNIAARLEGLAEPGGICLSRTVYSHVKGKLDLDFEDMGEHRVKNLPDAILAYKVMLDDKAAALVTPIVRADALTRPDRRPYAIAAVLAVVALGAGLAWWQPWAPEFAPAVVERMALPLPDKPSIAVLPFANFSGDAGQEYFADGMTEDLITDLSKLSGIFVISRNASWTYKGRAVKPQHVAEELGVRYLLEGSVRRSGDQVRINAQLIDAVGGHHLWAERYDGTITDVFALQDKVIGKIVAALAVSLTAAEQGDIGQAETAHPQAYDAVLQGLEHLRNDSEEETHKAIALFQRAVALDPEYGRAYAGLAAANWRIVHSLWTTTAGVGFEHAWARMNDNLAEAMMRPTSLAHAVAAQLRARQGDYDAAFAEIDQAMALAPNDPDNHVSKARILNATGRAEEAEEAARWALRLDPRYAPDYLRVLAIAQFHQERYAEAAATMRRVLSRQSDFPEDYATLIASLGHLGQLDEVPALIAKYNAIAVPAFFDPLTVQEMSWWWYGDMYSYDAAYRERLQEGLRKAGVPEGAGTDLARADYLRFIVKSGGEYSVTGATKIDVAEAKALHARGDVTFIDVRAPLEYAERHVPGARNLDLITDLTSERLAESVGKEDEVVFYCHGKHCPYSAYASAKALAWGYAKVYYFAGGFPAWHDAGYPVEGTPMAAQ